MAEVNFLRCQTNRVLVVMGEPEIIPVGDVDAKMLAAVRKAAVFVDAYPAIQPAKKFDIYKTIPVFIANPNAQTLLSAEPALKTLFHVVGELEGVLNECGDFDVQIQGVFPPPAPIGTALQPRPATPEPPVQTPPTVGPSIPSPTGNATQIVAFSVGAALLGGLVGYAWRRRKARRSESPSRRAQSGARASRTTRRHALTE